MTQSYTSFFLTNNDDDRIIKVIIQDRNHKSNGKVILSYRGCR